MQTYTICPSESKDCSNQLSLLKMTQADHKIVLYLELKVEDSLMAEAASYLHFKWLRFSTKGKIYNLSIETMLEEDRQIKEAILKHRNGQPIEIQWFILTEPSKVRYKYIRFCHLLNIIVMPDCPKHCPIVLTIFNIVSAYFIHKLVFSLSDSESQDSSFRPSTTSPTESSSSSSPQYSWCTSP